MFYRCKKCNRFLADVKNEKEFILSGKKITFENNKFHIECLKCGTAN